MRTKGGQRRNRGKRKNPFTWLPVLGSRTINAEDEYHEVKQRWFAQASYGQQFAPGTNGAIGIQTLPIIPDYTVEDSIDAGSSLRDITEGQSWLLKRIVGKIHLRAESVISGANGNVLPLYWPSLYCTFGIFVGRADDAAPGFPDLLDPEIDPQAADNVMNPWVWRRTWWFNVLDRARATSATPSAQYAVRPYGTMDYGSVADGPHIDSKVSRIIRREQRLWAVMTVTGGDFQVLSVTGQQTNQPVVLGYSDLRILGRMVKQKNSSAF